MTRPEGHDHLPIYSEKSPELRCSPCVRSSVISTLLLSALLPWPVGGQFRVIGPAAPVIASVGEEVVLPCHLSPVTDAEGMDVFWYRVSPSGLVHHYAEFQDILEQQQPEYQNRTEFLKKNINNGQVALKIHPVHTSDDGEYRCLFASSTFENEARFRVLVTALGKAPQIHIEPGNTGEVKLTCISMGWYPEPQVQWRDLQGTSLKPISEPVTADENGLIHVETSVTVNKGSKVLSCILRNPVLSEEKEARVSVSDALFPTSGFSRIQFALILALNIIFLSLLTSHFFIFFRKARKKGFSKKQKDVFRRNYDELKGKNGVLLTMNGALFQVNNALRNDYDALKKKYHDLMKVNGVSPEEQSSSSELLISLLQEESEETSGL